SQVAGCLVLLAQVENFFSRVRIDLLRKFANLLALAFKEADFFPLEHITLSVMPDHSAQLLALTLLNEQVKRILTLEQITRAEAEQRILRQWMTQEGSKNDH